MRRRSKYGNVRTFVGAIAFASKAEAARYRELLIQEKRGAIFNLTLQRPFPIAINGVKVCTYIADFTYSEQPSGRYVVEDVKGVRTAIYRLKAKLMLAVHGVAIQEIGARRRLTRRAV